MADKSKSGSNKSTYDPSKPYNPRKRPPPDLRPGETMCLADYYEIRGIVPVSSSVDAKTQMAEEPKEKAEKAQSQSQSQSQSQATQTEYKMPDPWYRPELLHKYAKITEMVLFRGVGKPVNVYSSMARTPFKADDYLNVETISGHTIKLRVARNPTKDGDGAQFKVTAECDGWITVDLIGVEDVEKGLFTMTSKDGKCKVVASV